MEATPEAVEALISPARVRLAFPDVRVRLFGASDAVALRDGFASGSISDRTRFMFPRSVAETVERLRQSKETTRFAIVVGGKFVGICTLRDPLFSGKELTIGIFDEAYHGRGIGTHVIRKVCAYGFKKLKLHRIELGVYPNNTRAIRCYARCGFQREALLRKLLYNDGEYRDIIWMSLLRNEWVSYDRHDRDW